MSRLAVGTGCLLIFCRFIDEVKLITKFELHTSKCRFFSRVSSMIRTRGYTVQEAYHPILKITKGECRVARNRRRRVLRKQPRFVRSTVNLFVVLRVWPSILSMIRRHTVHVLLVHTRTVVVKMTTLCNLIVVQP